MNSENKYSKKKEIALSPCLAVQLGALFNREGQSNNVVEIDDIFLSRILINADRLSQFRDGLSTVYNVVFFETEHNPNATFKILSHGEGYIGDNTNYNFLTEMTIEGVRIHKTDFNNPTIQIFSDKEDKLRSKTIHAREGECPFKTIRFDYENMQGLNAEIEFTPAGLKNLVKTIKADKIVLSEICGDEVYRSEHRGKGFLKYFEELTKPVFGAYKEISFEWTNSPGNEKVVSEINNGNWLITENNYTDPTRKGHETDFTRGYIRTIIEAPKEK